MSKYDPLMTYLMKVEENRITLTIEEIERILSFKLPPSAKKYREWWANGGHVQANSWIDAGWKVDQVKLGDCTTFIQE